MEDLGSRLVTDRYELVPCVASVPVQAERNIGPRERVFAFRTRGKWGENKKGRRPSRQPSTFLLSPHFPRVPNAKTPFRAPIFRSACTGKLATQGNELITAGFCYFLFVYLFVCLFVIYLKRLVFVSLWPSNFVLIVVQPIL